MASGMKYGLLAAAGMSVWLFLVYALGLHGAHLSWGRYVDWGTELILVYAIWRLLRHEFESRNRYWLPVWQGWLHGLFASLIAAMGFYVVFSLYLRFVNPEFPDLYLEWRVAHARAGGQPEEEIRAMAKAFRWSMGPIGLPSTVLIFYLLVGLVASPILTLWLNWRRKESGRIG